MSQLAQFVDVAYTKGCELRVGNRIHLNTFRGTYWITALTATTMTITCSVWRYREQKEQTLPLSAFENYYNARNGSGSPRSWSEDKGG